jgi:hypothetical protein
MLVSMAVNSEASVFKFVRRFAFTILESSSNSSQNKDSSASSSTTPILDANSALDLALHAAR